ncbi:hypothetical protein CEP52_007840 [Fusarium oligoseptatum]|uniref:Uncharacterized protein n=1 Tax=Fusarium oligoseptatum TaxID=2604345 RepID=A0A428TKP4_9HYPO|nr:hypothetical protein CEP52_007840 [Fusarium oligoseptatum]
MSQPLINSPTSVSLGNDRFTQPQNMVAIRVNAPCTVDVKLEDGSVARKEIDAGYCGYLVEHQGDESLVQLFNRLGTRALAKIPWKNLDFGRPPAEFRAILPALQAANVAARISNHRANDTVAKAIVMIWEDILKNIDTLQHLGLRRGIYEDILQNDEHKQQALQTLIGSFSNEAWAALNTPNLPLRSLLKLKKITSTYPRIKPDQAVIYLRLYTASNADQTQFAKYVGKTTREYPHIRQMEHEELIAAGSNMPHYREAKKYPQHHAIPMMLFTSSRAEMIPMAETTLCFLLRTWDPNVTGLSQPAVASGLSSATVEHRIFMSTLSNIADAALRRQNLTLFGGRGCNWNCPLQEGYREKREWLRYRVTTQEKRTMFVYRFQSCVTRMGLAEGPGHAIGIRILFLSKIEKGSDYQGPKWRGFVLKQPLDKLPGIKVGQPLIVSIEMMEDGKPHSQPWYRAPYHGAWSNCSELHSFSIKVEWVDEEAKQWYTFPLSHQHIVKVYEAKKPTADPTVTLAWRKATMILQFICNRRYRNPPTFLDETYRPNIKEVVYDHLAQTVSLQQVPETVMDPPHKVSFDYNWYEGLAVARRYEVRGIPIKAPMSISDYYECKEHSKDNTVEETDIEADGEED